MWSIEQLEEIRDDCLQDIRDAFPDIADKISKPRIEINHRRINTLASYSRSRIEISAYLLDSKTTRVFFQTLFMKVLIKTQPVLCNDELSYEQIISIFQEKHADKYDFEEYRNLKKHNISIPQNKETYKYAVRCPQCGEIFRYKRICKTVISPQDYYCRKCNVSLERI